jgi:ribosome-interacting GTPase 1
MKAKQSRTYADKVAVGVAESEEVLQHAALGAVVDEIRVSTNQLWFNLAQLFNHLWTVTKLIFVYNNEPGRGLHSSTFQLNLSRF